MSSFYCASCGAEMDFIHCDDVGVESSSEGFSLAYNLYACPCRFAICGETVWDFKSRVWVFADNKMFEE